MTLISKQSKLRTWNSNLYPLNGRLLATISHRVIPKEYTSAAVVYSPALAGGLGGTTSGAAHATVPGKSSGLSERADLMFCYLRPFAFCGNKI